MHVLKRFKLELSCRIMSRGVDDIKEMNPNIESLCKELPADKYSVFHLYSTRVISALSECALFPPHMLSDDSIDPY